VLSLPPEVTVNTDTLNCLIDDIEKLCVYNASGHDVTVHQLCKQAI